MILSYLRSYIKRVDKLLKMIKTRETIKLQLFSSRIHEKYPPLYEYAQYMQQEQLTNSSKIILWGILKFYYYYYY